jgi:hypothetical protein
MSTFKRILLILGILSLGILLIIEGLTPKEKKLSTAEEKKTAGTPAYAREQKRIKNEQELAERLEAERLEAERLAAEQADELDQNIENLIVNKDGIHEEEDN